MSWLEKGISSLKGQITNFTKEVLAEEDPDSRAAEDPAGPAGLDDGEAASPHAQLAPHADQGHLAAHAAHAAHHEQAEGFFGQASAALSGLPLPLFGRSSPAPATTATMAAPDEQLQQHCGQLESTVQRLLQQLEEVSEARDKEALELATLRRELRLRGHHAGHHPAGGADSGPGSRSGSGSGPGSGNGDSPQPDDASLPQGADGTGVSPALSDDGFTKLDPSETELWEATQELSQSLEAQVELHKKELEKCHQMKQDWTLEKTNLVNTIQMLQKQLNALQDWQSPDPDFANGNEVELNQTIARLLKENETLKNERTDFLEKLKVMEQKLADLEKEKTELTANMEELDSQNQDTLNQFLEIKRGVEDKYDSLKTEHENILVEIMKVREERDILRCSERENDELKERYAALQSQHQSLTSEKDDVEKKYAILEDKLLSDHSLKLSSLEKEKEDLISKLSFIQSENTDLLTKIDSIQLDFDSLEVKYTTVLSENETLKTKLNAAHCDLESAKSGFSGKSNVENITSEQHSAELISTERYVVEKLRKIVSLEIPDEYCKDIAERDDVLEKELEDQLDMVAALVKMTVDLRWKKETLERNLVEYTRQLRDMTAQLSARDKQVAKLEEECVMLRENMESLLDGLNVTPDKGMLPSIPETSEAGEEELSEGASYSEQENKQEFCMRSDRSEEKDLCATISNLESEVEILREARSNLEHETKRLRGEVQELMSRLRSSEGMLRNQDNLEREMSRWRDQYEHLRSAHSDLQKESSQLKEEAEMARFGQDSLQAEVSEWKTIADAANQERQSAIQEKETLAAELAVLKADMAAAGSRDVQLEQALLQKSALEAEVIQLQQSVNALEESNSKLKEADVVIEDLRSKVSSLKDALGKKNETTSETKVHEITELVKKIENLEIEKKNVELSLSETVSENGGLCEHIMTLQQKCDSLSADLACKASSEYDNTQNFLHEKQALEEQVTRMTVNYETVKKNFEELSSFKSEMQAEMDQLKQSLQISHEENSRLESLLEQKSQNEVLLNRQLDSASAAQQANQEEVKLLQEQLVTSQSTSDPNLGNDPIVQSLERKLHSMLEEKEQMLSVLNEKTRENGVLRSENQKLLTAISNQPESNPIVNIDQPSPLIQQLNQLKQERDQLISTVQVKHNESLKYHAEIVRLSSLLDQKQQTDQGSVVQHANTQETLQSGENLNKNPELCKLESQCNSLAVSLQQEKAQNAYLQNEMQEQHEKEGILTRELERLRAHLMEVEETYTAETLRLEELVQDLQSKLNTAEERLRSVSTAHTSASILANQHVESLQGQSRLIGQQRDELQSKLSAAEDREQKHAAALRNLQAVLEQFQRDKERDLSSMTEKLRLQLNAAHKKHEDLSEEIQKLKDQLTEAKEGLSAAARLGAQLDKKSETINSLKEQISLQQKELAGAEERIRAASQSVEGKVDKSLVKNLVVGLLTAPANTRSPALKVVASVLDFNFEERQKVGLEHSSGHNEQSLSEAFVRFLESESRPQMQLRLLPNAASKSQGDSRKDSQGNIVATSESPARRSPLLSEIVLPTLAPLPAGRSSSSSILKDVLKNDL